MERKIGIIGAGISGLLACKYALAKGYNPLVFESRNTIGGVWTQTMEITKLQTPKDFYQFSDFPWPSNIGSLYPTHTQVLDYLNSYAKHFDLVKHIRFNTKVIGIKYNGPPEAEMEAWDVWGGNGEPFGNKESTWSIIIEDLVNNTIEVMKVDFVILCLGRYSDVPNVPNFPKGKGPEVFQGKVMHSNDYSNLDHNIARDFIKGKKVTVVGFRKSALDVAMECSNVNGVEHPCSVICRSPFWSPIDNLSWGISIPFGYLYMNRFSELLVHKPSEGLLLAAVATLLSPLRWAITKFVESNIKKERRLEKFNMVPDYTFNTCLISSIPEGFYDNVEKGRIILKRSPTFHFCKEGIRLSNNAEAKAEVVKSDLVILATGFKGDQKLKDVFASPMFRNYIMGSLNKIAPLYRQCIHPRIPQLAVIGYSESFSNLHTFEMKCRWLMELLDEKFKLPCIQKMEKNVLEWDKFMKRYSGKYYRKSCLSGVQIWYNDQLCKDIGLNPKRKNGFLAEIFEPYTPMDYASI